METINQPSNRNNICKSVEAKKQRHMNERTKKDERAMGKANRKGKRKNRSKRMEGIEI